MYLLQNLPKRYTITEAWTSAENSYDLHAPLASLFDIEDVGGVKNAVFTVNAGDKYNGSSGERAEVVLGGYSNSVLFYITGLETETEYYRFKVKLASPWERPDVNEFGYQWGMCFQVHGPNDFATSPNIALYCENVFGLFVFGGDVAYPTGELIDLTNNALVLDVWVDFVIEVKWSTTTNGHAALYRKDDGQSAFTKMGEVRNIPTLQWEAAEKAHPHYVKAGFYRSESDHTNTVRIGPITRTTVEAVAFA